MSVPLSTDDKRRIAEPMRQARIKAALEGALCHEGIWENAISTIHKLNLEGIIDDHGPSR